MISSTTAPNRAIPQLPADIYLEILKVLPASRDDDTAVQTLLSCLEANSGIRTAALSPLAWQHHYQARYLHCVDANEAQRRERTGGDWRLMYRARRRLDRRAMELVDEIRLSVAGRHEKARVFAKELSFDVWDALKLESQMALPQYFREGGNDAEQERALAAEDVLPRRFWAQTILGVIARREAVDVWKSIFIPEADAPPVQFVEALSSLSSVFDVSIREVSSQLDEIFEACTEALPRHQVRHAPTILQRQCISICHVLFSPEVLGFGLAEGPIFHRLLNQFPHAFLQQEYRQTIPMSMVFVFVAIARRMGIDASPVDYPGAVQAHIQPSDPSEPSFLLDVTSDIPTPVPVEGRIATAHTDHTRPASSLTMLIRSFNNMIQFARFERVLGATSSARSWSPEVQDSAFYLMTMCTVLRTQQMHTIPTPPEFNPLDLVAVLLDGLAPVLQNVPRGLLSGYLENNWKIAEDRATRKRTRAENPHVAAFVGMVFTHKRYGYTGCIHAWDSSCAASETWMDDMGVDELPSGRHQPFYSVLSTDGGVFYVAQDNIQPVRPTREVIRSLFLTRSSFSRYFTGVDVSVERGLGRLKPSHELKLEYPDDDAAGRLWVHGHSL